MFILISAVGWIVLIRPLTRSKAISRPWTLPRVGFSPHDIAKQIAGTQLGSKLELQGICQWNRSSNCRG